MPELPEVETIRRYLAEMLPGVPIERVEHLDPRMVKHSPLNAGQITERLTGAVFSHVDRIGKFLLLRLQSDEALLLHLGMSGRLVVESHQAPLQPHTHLQLALGDRDLRLADPRRFGRIAWVAAGEEPALGLGVEPLSRRFTATVLQDLLSGRKSAIKSALLNQSLVAGLGNIYVDESLFLSRIHPSRLAGSLSLVEARALARAIRRVLELSLEHRGTSFSDYVDALGHPGDNLQYLNVYGREGKPCRRCRTPIARIVMGGRSSHFCPRCQPVAGGVQTRTDESISGKAGDEGDLSHAEI